MDSNVTSARTAGGTNPFPAARLVSGCGDGTVMFSADPVHHSVAVKYTVAIVAAHQYIRKLAHFLLVFAVEVGEAAFGTISVTQFKFNLVKPRGINMDCNVEFIIVLVTARMAALLVALGVLIENLFLVLSDVCLNVGAL